MPVSNVTTIITNETVNGLAMLFGGNTVIGTAIVAFFLIAMISNGFDRGAIMFFGVLITGLLASLGYFPPWVFMAVLAVITLFIIKAFISLTGE